MFRISHQFPAHFMKMPEVGERLVSAVRDRLQVIGTAAAERPGLAGSEMFFVLRACFWICVVWLLMPNPLLGARPQTSARAAAPPSLLAETVETAAHFCRQQKGTCQAVVRKVAADKLRQGAKLLESTAEADLSVPLPVARPAKRKAG